MSKWGSGSTWRGSPFGGRRRGRGEVRGLGVETRGEGILILERTFSGLRVGASLD